MKKLLNIFMLSCLRASELIEKRLVGKLSAKERIQLSMHTSMCDACKSWEKQSKDLDNSLKTHRQSHKQQPINETESLSDEVKKSIIRKIEEKQ